MMVFVYTGTSAGLLGTNDYEAGNDFPLSDGSQAENMDNFFHSWQVRQVDLITSSSSKLLSIIMYKRHQQMYNHMLVTFILIIIE